jgi:DNA-binding FrmR family transcriptional regulator
MEALSQLLEGFAELQDSLDTEYGEVEDDEDKDDDATDIVDPDAAIIKELKIAIEGSIETDDYTPEEIANLIAALTEALEEVDPNVFADSSEDDEEEEEEDDDDYEDDDDDLDLDEDEDEEEIEEEEEDEDDEDEAPKKRGGAKGRKR